MEPTLKNIMLFFEMTPGQFSKEWTNKSGDLKKVLTPEDKEQIKSGLGNDSLTY